MSPYFELERADPLDPRASVFPTSVPHSACIPGEGCRVHAGLSKREWFAGMALQGLLARQLDPRDLAYEPEQSVRNALAFADKMLEELARTP